MAGGLSGSRRSIDISRVLANTEGFNVAGLGVGATGLLLILEYERKEGILGRLKDLQTSKWWRQNKQQPLTENLPYQALYIHCITHPYIVSLTWHHSPVGEALLYPLDRCRN